MGKIGKNADPRVAVGDTLLAVSASFGSEIWPALNYPQTMMSINTRIGNVYMKMQSVGKKDGIRKQLFGRGKAAEEEEEDLEEMARLDKRANINSIFQTVATVGGLGICVYIAYIVP